LFRCLVAPAVIAGLPAWANLKVTPTSLSFSYQVGAASLPASQTLNVTPASGNTPLSLTVSTSGEPWLTVTPLSGRTPLAVKITANPTSLAVGSYAATVTLIAGVAGAQPVNALVSLLVKAAPSNLSAAPASLSFSWRRGDTLPAGQTLSLTTSGAILSYSITAAGGGWLSLTPATGIVFPGFPAQVSTAVSPGELAPGTYKATLTVSSPSAANKTQTVAVNLTVLPGAPSLSAVWPARATAGAPDTTITLTGSNFCTGTTVTAGSTTLKAAILGPSALTAVLPSKLLEAPSELSLSVANPDPGGGSSGTISFLVIEPGPKISAVVNAASYLAGAVAPGELLTIFGTGIGPDNLTTFPSGATTVPTSLAGTRVLFGTTPAPIFYSSANQTGIVVPFGLTTNTPVMMRLEYGGEASDDLPLLVASEAPAIFTFSGSGSGPAAAFNYHESTKEYSVNADANGAPKGSVVVFYATGTGKPTPAPADGAILTQPSSANDPRVTVEIGGANAEVLYAGSAPGLVAGVVQVNVRVPDSISAGKATPVTMKVSGIPSQPGVTVSVK
jgi:uncharacterized protein (TIGR03437 family)